MFFPIIIGLLVAAFFGLKLLIYKALFGNSHTELHYNAKYDEEVERRR